MNSTHRRHTITGCVALTGLLFMGACDVTNPGPVQDAFLSQKESHEALVNGSGRRLLEAMNFISYTSALPAREIFPGGQTGAHGHDVLVQGGYLEPGSFDGHFNDAVQARFVAETALDLFAEVEGTEDEAEPEVIQQAMVWAGYANRVLGENWCQAVFDGGEAQPGSVYMTRAEEHFTNAINNGTDPELVLAARAGRAQVRVWLGDWDGAETDAGAITDESWEFALNSVNQDPPTRNRLYYANADAPYRGYTMWFTYYGGSDSDLEGQDPSLPEFDGYYELTGDPRVSVLPQSETVPFSNAALQGYGQTPWLNQEKYTGGGDDFRLASYDEMRLIEAEAALNDGDWPEAMDIIGDLREGIESDNGGQLDRTPPDVFGQLPGWDPLPPASDVPTAMSYLMRERAIELWGEARRLGDLRRWEDGQGLGGDVRRPPFELVSEVFDDAKAAADQRGGPDRLRCFDIPDDEREANPNIPTVN
ncbi:MAG: RagB/SusD family nutrient uptake outer membrane protein [Gemmatimonadota bacterium]|nr:RagB/SusD family nutrient uptake outer membrane protein [Gemmatimonadota bacterium]